MNEEPSVPTHQPGGRPADGRTEPGAIAGAIIQPRRRFLTQGLVGGSVALLATARPVESLASNPSCTWSAWKSAAAGTVSVQPACDPPGQAPSYYYSSGQATSHWPKSQYPIGDFFYSIFGGGANKQFFYIFENSNSYFVEYHFITALFNAYLFNSSNYPYNTAGIIKLYKSAGGNTTTLSSMATYLEALE